jgi:hypothetical protein
MSDRVTSAEFRAMQSGRKPSAGSRKLTKAARTVADATRASLKAAAVPFRASCGETFLEALAPVRIHSANEHRREVHQARARRVRIERHAVSLSLSATRESREAVRRLAASFPLVVTITRIAPRPITDEDNLIAGAKAPRDSVAAVFGVDDGDPRWTWKYSQERGDYAVRIRIEMIQPGAPS